MIVELFIVDVVIINSSTIYNIAICAIYFFKFKLPVLLVIIKKATCFAGVYFCHEDTKKKIFISPLQGLKRCMWFFSQGVASLCPGLYYFALTGLKMSNSGDFFGFFIESSDLVHERFEPSLQGRVLLTVVTYIYDR